MLFQWIYILQPGGHMWLQCCSVWAENLKFEADVSFCILRDKEEEQGTVHDRGQTRYTDVTAGRRF